MNPIEEKHYMKNEDQKSYENLCDAIVHATITKETAVGFYEWCKYNEFYECTREQRDIPTPELYDIYVKSLKPETVEK
jgi:hypothetical protein